MEPKKNNQDDTDRIMGRLVRMPPKPHSAERKRQGGGAGEGRKRTGKSKDEAGAP